MLRNKLNCPVPYNWQVQGIEQLISNPDAVVVLSRPPGDGKSTVIKGAAYTVCGVTLLISPTILLSSFMAKTYDDHFECINLDTVKSSQLVDCLKTKLRSLKSLGGRLKRYIVLATPSSLARDGWSKFFFRLGRSGVLRLVVCDEAHIPMQHGLTFRRDEYNIMSKFLFRPLMELRKKKKPGPNIALVSATMRDVTIDYIVKTFLGGVDNEYIYKIQATPRELSRRDIEIHMKVRQPKDATSDWKKIVSSFLCESRGEKAILLSNFKSKIEAIRDHAYECVKHGEDIFVVAIDGDDDAVNKAAAITTFCEKRDHSLCRISRLAVISAATGVEGYDCSKIRLVIRLGIPTSLEQMFQELGRIRKNPNSVNSKYYLYPCVADYVNLRYVWKRQQQSERSYHFAVEQLDEVLCLITGSKCWALRFEELFGLGIDATSFGWRKCGNCPHCCGEIKSCAPSVDRVQLRNHLSVILSTKRPTLIDFVGLLWSDNNICNRLYRKKKSAMPKYQVDFLVLHMIPRGIIQLVHENDLLVVQLAVMTAENGDVSFAHNDDNKWSGVPLL